MKHWNQSSLKSLWGILLMKQSPFIYSTNTNTQDSLCLYTYSSKSTQNEATFGLSINNKWKKWLTTRPIMFNIKLHFLGLLSVGHNFKGYLCISRHWSPDLWTSCCDHILSLSSCTAGLDESCFQMTKSFPFRVCKKRQINRLVRVLILPLNAFL